MKFIMTSLASGTYSHYFYETGEAPELIEELSSYQSSLVFINAGDVIFFYTPGTSILYKASYDFSTVISETVEGTLLAGGWYDAYAGVFKIAAVTPSEFSLLSIVWGSGGIQLSKNSLSSFMASAGIPHKVTCNAVTGYMFITGSRTLRVSSRGQVDFPCITSDDRIFADDPFRMFYSYNPYTGVISCRYPDTSGSGFLTLWEVEPGHPVNSIIESYDLRLYIFSDTLIYVYSTLTGELLETLTPGAGVITGLSLNELRYPGSGGEIALNATSADLGDVAVEVGNNVGTLGLTAGSDTVIDISLPSGMYASVVPGVWETGSLSFEMSAGASITVALHKYVKVTGAALDLIMIRSGRMGEMISVPVRWTGVNPETAVLPVKIKKDSPGIFDQSVTLTAGNGKVRSVRLTGTFS